MNFSEVIRTLEKCVGSLRLKYKNGKPMEPEVALARIGSFHGTRYDEIIQKLSDGQITIEVYLTEMVKMINEYRYRFESCSG